MTITDVKGYPTDDGGVDRIDIEGDSPYLDKLEVSLEVTGKQLKRSVTVRKDRTWTARFKASDGVDLLGFNCGTLVKAGASSKGDEPQHVVWTGCVRCVDDDVEQGADAQAEQAGAAAEEPNAANSSDGQPAHAGGEAEEEPLVLVRRGEGGGDQAVVTVTVGRSSADQDERQGPRTTRRPPDERKRTRRRTSRNAERDGSDRGEAPREPEHHGGDDEMRRDRSESVVRKRAQDDVRPTRHPEFEDGPRSRREAPHDDEREDGLDQEDDRRYDDEPRRRDERGEARDRSERRDEPRRDDRDRYESRDRYDDRGRYEEQERREASQRKGREPASWPIGAAVMTATALFLFSIAAQAYPMMVGLATALVVPTWAFVLAGYTPASWARWAGAGVGLAALAIPGSMAFVDFIGADVYLVAAGVAALGIAIASGLLFFRSGEDDEDEDRED